MKPVTLHQLRVFEAAARHNSFTRAAEELYLCLSGTPRFRSDRQGETTLKPGQFRAHSAWESHAMETGSAPFLTYALWRGVGLEAPPILERPA